jgi:hypothetical protein
MAALLGGTATYGAVEPGLNNEVFNENPDDPAAEQRRFNFFDYAADGQINGALTMNELKMLSRILLPSPDAGVITDRQRASANGWLVAPTAQRNFVQLQHMLPTFEWVPAAALKRFRNISPAKFGVDQGLPPGNSFPLYTLFDASVPATKSGASTSVVTASKSAMINGANITVNWLANVPTMSTASPTTAPTTKTTEPSTLSPAGTVTPNGTGTPGATAPASTAPGSSTAPGTTIPSTPTPGTSTSTPAVSATPPAASTQPDQSSTVLNAMLSLAGALPSSSPVTPGTLASLIQNNLMGATPPTGSPAAASTSPAVASATASSPPVSTPAASTPPATPAAATAPVSEPTGSTKKVKRAEKAKPKSGNSVSKFFDRLGNSINKAFG